MLNYKGDKLVKSTLLTSIVVLLLLTNTSITMVNASLDLSNLNEVKDIGQNADCVVVVEGCDGTGSVDSSGDTTIGSNNGNNDSVRGEQGPPGPEGPAGPQSIDGKVYAVTGEAVTGNNQPITASATCNTGDTVMSGGYKIDPKGIIGDLQLIENGPTSDLDGWEVTVEPRGDIIIQATAVCFDNP